MNAGFQILYKMLLTSRSRRLQNGNRFQKPVSMVSSRARREERHFILCARAKNYLETIDAFVPARRSPFEALQHMQTGLKKTVYVVLALMSSCLPVQVFAQAVGSIVGTVTDSTGAVIVQAKVFATREDTGISQSTLTSDAGTFAIPHLSVGTYTVRVGAPGFATKSVTGAMLDVSQQRELDFNLSPRAVGFVLLHFSLVGP
jgi:hypothetical protein